MAILKCKMCGGDIELSADKTFGTCEYCGSTMTFPKVDDEQRAAMFNRGNHFRRTGEFDKALAVYERIVQEDENDAEAHWCCALCRFGIEYVEDPNTLEYLPTCHRASFDSFLEDVDYLAALEHSDGITRRQYQKDAAKIAEVQRGILATSRNEEPFDVFLCYKETEDDGSRTRDSLYAQDIYYQLTEQGRRVFFSRITLEDKAGTEYEPYIFAALNSAKVMILVTTSAEHANAVWVKNEWSRFLSLMRKDRSKLLLPCYRDMDPYDLPEALSVLQSYDMSKIGFIQDLIRGVNKVLNTQKPKYPVKETVIVQPTVNGAIAPLLKRAFLFLEDGDWQSADEYCEKVLDMDPENGEAYLGKLMTELHIRKREQLKDQALPFDDNKTYQKVIRFGDEKLKAELIGTIAFINDRNETARKEKIYQQACQQMQAQRYAEAQALFDSIPEYKDATAQLEACVQQAELLRQENIYRQATQRMGEQKYKEAKALFDSIPDHRDAQAQSDACVRQAELLRQEGVYQQAARRMEEQKYAEAKKLFDSIPVYRDAAAQSDECVRLQAVQRQETSYQQAMDLARQGTEEGYAEAAKVMAALLGYKDAQDKAVRYQEKAESIRKEQVYRNAVKLASYRSMAELEEAARLFGTVSGYKDADKQLFICQNKIQELQAKEEAKRLKRQQKEKGELAEEYAAETGKRPKRSKTKDFIVLIACCLVAGILIGIAWPMLRKKGGEDSSSLGSSPESVAKDNSKDITAKGMISIVNLINGNLGDKSFFDSAQSGMVALEQAGLAKYRTIEMGNDSSTWQNRIEEVAASKSFDIIICGTRQMEDKLTSVAQKYPGQLFIFYDSEATPGSACLPNVASVRYKQNDMGYLVGVYAALLETKSDLTGLNKQKILGFVGGEESPLICDFLVGYIEGAWSIDPDIKVDWRWIGNYFDSALGKEIGAAEIEAGADIVWGVGGAAGTGVAEACYEKGKYYIGVDSDQEQTLDHKYAAITMTSGLKNVGTSLEYVIKKYLEGDRSFFGTCTALGLAEDGVGIAMAGNFAKQSREIQDTVLAAKEAILSGELAVDSAFDPAFDYYRLMNSAITGETFSRANEMTEASVGLQLERKTVRHTIAACDVTTIALKTDGTVVTAGGSDPDSPYDVSNWKYIDSVVAGGYHVLGLKADGTVKATGRNTEGQCEVSEWKDIVSIAATWFFSAGLKADGTLSTAGLDTGQYDVSEWTDIVALEAGWEHVLCLKADGTVVAVGVNGYGQCDVSDWTDIVAIMAGGEHSVGLKTDGTVVATGWNEYGQCNVDSWTNIVAIEAGFQHTVGLKPDGTVVAIGDNEYGQCEVSDWTDIVAIAAGTRLTLGLKKDGTVVTTWDKDVSWWKDIVAIAAGHVHGVGLKADGTMVAIGGNDWGQCNVSAWTDIRVPEKQPAASKPTQTAGISYPNPKYTKEFWDQHAVHSTIAASNHTVAIKTDGTVVATGSNDHGQCNVSGWKDIVEVAVGWGHTVGLRANGTVVATEFTGDQTDNRGQCEISDWTNIVSIAANASNTFGVKADGTVIVAGRSIPAVSGWTDITAVVASEYHVMGLKADGSVVAYGGNASGWKNIVSIAAGRSHIVGLRADGFVVAAGSNEHGECNVSGWTDITAISATGFYTIGLKKDGTVVIAGSEEMKTKLDVSQWKDIVAVAAGQSHVVGLKANGTMVAVGSNANGKLDVSNWTDIKLPEKIDSAAKINEVKQKLSATEVGSTVFFGSYEQDNVASNGKEAIEWIVLAKEGNRALLISRYALDCQQYNTSWTSVTWETCSLRKWLNGTFIRNAFSSDEQRIIKSTTVTADKNPSYSTSPGNDTTDKVFLLSITEVNKYFSSNSARQCKGTDYCYAKGAYKDTNGNCWWWLRSPGYHSDCAAYVYYDGSVGDYGDIVYGADDAVRPALWIDLGS